MRKLFGTVVFIGVIVAVVGLFRGWFSVDTHDEPDETNVEVRIDKEKIRQDTKQAAQAAKEISADIERRID